MFKNYSQIEELKNNQKKLEAFIYPIEEKLYKGNEIRKWMAECIVHFTELKINQSIIDYFIKKLEYTKKEIKIEDPTKRLLARSYFPVGDQYLGDQHPSFKELTEMQSTMGPFCFDEEKGGYVIRGINRLLPNAFESDPYMVPILIAFELAKNKINNYEEANRIIPTSLLDIFDNEKTQNIFVSLQNIQNSFESDKKKMPISLITTTDLVCELIPSIKRLKSKKLSLKLDTLYKNKNICTRYNINKEIIWSLNNSRLIRNYDTHEPNKINQLTLFEAVGYVHILMLFINSLLSSGKIKLTHK